jgi:hypothetical protein
MADTLTPPRVHQPHRSHPHPVQAHVRRYRLVDGRGAPHPVLDDLYDSLEAAWAEATRWWHNQFGAVEGPVEIGIEVSTASGDWRTLRFPGT